MSIQTWEGLQKSATDSETIEQAIDRLIAVHEGDATSHLGVGESLQAHKNADVIDHPAGSVVADKFSNAQSFLDFITFPPVSGLEDNCTLEQWPPLSGIYQASPFSGGGSYSCGNFIPTDYGYASGDILFDFIISCLGGAGTWQNEFYFSFGKIQIKSGYYRIGYYTGSWQYTSWISVDHTKYLRFRFSYKANENKLYVYLGNVEVLSVSYTILFAGGSVKCIAMINRGSSTSTTFIFGNIKLWFDGM